MFCIMAPCTLHINSKMTPSQRWKGKFKGHWTLWFFPLYHDYRKPVLNNMMLVCCENSQYLCASHISCCHSLLVLTVWLVLPICVQRGSDLQTEGSYHAPTYFIVFCIALDMSPKQLHRHKPPWMPGRLISRTKYELHGWLTMHWIKPLYLNVIDAILAKTLRSELGTSSSQ